MRMLLVLLLLLNVGLTAYYLMVDGQAPPARPTPSAGTLDLVSEMARARKEGVQRDGDGTAVSCWRSPPIPRGEPLQAALASLDRGGYSRLRVEPVSSGYAVVVGRADTIQAAAAEVERLEAAGVPAPRVRPATGGGLVIMSGRFDTAQQARGHADSLRSKGIDAGVLSPESGGEAVRVYAKGNGAPPAAGWDAVNCQP